MSQTSYQLKIQKMYYYNRDKFARELFKEVRIGEILEQSRTQDCINAFWIMHLN